jgi:dCMP deaminase
VRPDWDSYFIEVAHVISTRADCVRRKVGAVVVDRDHRIVSTGYNGAPSGQPGCLTKGACPRGRSTIEPYAPYEGNCIAVHAELNAILYARRDLRGCTIYITCEPCQQCRQLLLAAGIERVVYP